MPDPVITRPRPVVYEAVDATCEETYYTIGIWPDLAGAVAAIKACGTDPPGEDFDYDTRLVEIRERPVGVIGWSDNGRVVARFCWERDSDENYAWVMRQEDHAINPVVDAVVPPVTFAFDGRIQPWPPDYKGHWWSGWPGAFCMRCGAADPFEEALADNVYDPVDDTWTSEERRLDCERRLQCRADAVSSGGETQN